MAEHELTPSPWPEASPDLLFVVPCLNEERHIRMVVERALADAGAQAAPVFVVDGGSTDRTCEIVREMAAVEQRVRLIHNPLRIQSAAVNLVVREHAKDCTHLVRLDAHADYPRDYGSSLRRVAVEVGADSVVVPMRAVGETCFQKAVAAAQNSRLSNGGSPHRVGGKSGFVDHGHHGLFRIASLRAVGGYDERFIANEDAELDVRLTQAGAKIFMSSDNGIIYFPRTSPSALWRQYRRHGYGRSNTLRLHRQTPKVRQLLPIMLAPAVCLVLLAPVFPPFALPLLAWAVACLGYGLVLGFGGRSGCEALSGVAAMIMHFAWSVGYWQGRLNPLPPRRDLVDDPPSASPPQVDPQPSTARPERASRPRLGRDAS